MDKVRKEMEGTLNETQKSIVAQVHAIDRMIEELFDRKRALEQMKIDLTKYLLDHGQFQYLQVNYAKIRMDEHRRNKRSMD